MGRRNETNRTVLAIVYGKILPESLERGRDEIQSNEHDDRKQLQGKPNTKTLSTEVIQHYKIMSATKSEYISIDEYNSTRIHI